MANRDTVLKDFFDHFVLKWEGGFSTKASGDGHVTLMGMTAKQYAARYHRSETSVEAEFNDLAKAINKRTGAINPELDAINQTLIHGFRDQVFHDFKTAYYEKPGFHKITSDHVGAVVADISFNRGPSTTFWVMAKMLEDQQMLAIDAKYDPTKIADPLTNPDPNNPYKTIDRATRHSLINGVNTLVEQKGEAFAIQALANAKLAHHEAQVAAQPQYQKFAAGWKNRLNDYNAYYTAHATPTPAAEPTPAEITETLQQKPAAEPSAKTEIVFEKNVFAPPPQNTQQATTLPTTLEAQAVEAAKGCFRMNTAGIMYDNLFKGVPLTEGQSLRLQNPNDQETYKELCAIREVKETLAKANVSRASPEETNAIVNRARKELAEGQAPTR